MLGDVARAACFDRPNEDALVRIGGHHHDLRVGQLRLDAFGGVYARPVGQLVVHQHDIRGMHPSSRDRLLDGSGRADDDDVVFLLEGAHDALREHRVVVGYQDGDLAFASHSLPLFGGGYHRAFGRTGPRSRVLMPGRGCARNGR